MPAQVIKVSPPTLLEAAAAVAGTSARTGPQPGAVPTAVPGSPFDGAWTGLGATMGTQAATMTTQAAGVGPALQGTSQTAVSTLQAEDDQQCDPDSIGRAIRRRYGVKTAASQRSSALWNGPSARCLGSGI